MVHLVEHPVAQDALLELRDVRTTPARFRQLARRLTTVLALEALRDLETETGEVTTPLGPATGKRLRENVVLVPVLRAGLGMLEGLLDVVPHARVGHLGLQRDEHTAVASAYYAKLPPGLDQSTVLLIDPMLATGGSAISALDQLAEAGGRDLRVLCIVAAPEGIRAVAGRHPSVHIFTPAVDERLNERKFIVPGLGDFGDRLYGT